MQLFNFNLPDRPSRSLTWLIGLATLPLLGVVAAFGIAPDTVTSNIHSETVTTQVALPVTQSTEASAPLDFWREERIRRGDTLPLLLNRLGVTQDETSRLLKSTRKNPAFKRLIPGRSVLARISQDGQIILLRYLVRDDVLVSIERQGNGFTARERAVKLERRELMRAGIVHSSLYGAMDAADVPDSIASEMAEIFSGEVDFHRNMSANDNFSVVYEAFYHDGELIRTGRLLAAEFVNRGEAHQAIYFRNSRGQEGYFTPDGRNLKRAFLKSPMRFSRISSGFSNARFHPILQEWRAHRGIDYAAPTGTPVRAIADAVVSFSGTKSGYGNLIELKHFGAYSTAYGHLSGYAKGVRKGARIKQGQIIGYVGMTGLASGPHLHYEFRINGEQRDPLTLKLPTSVALDSYARGAFTLAAHPYAEQLQQMRGRNLAAID